MSRCRHNTRLKVSQRFDHDVFHLVSGAKAIFGGVESEPSGLWIVRCLDCGRIWQGANERHSAPLWARNAIQAAKELKRL